MDVTLVVLAAGMGSRFGGLKQIEPVGPNGEFIIDYSIYDAIRVGFTKVVFIIKKENLDIFKSTVGKRIEGKIKVEYAFQDIEDAKSKYGVNKDRIKPLGTTHAILCAKDYVQTPFVIINADDFYGKEAFIDAMNFLKETNYQKSGAILYEVANTLTENGAVKRGICQIENNRLVKAVESSVLKNEEGIIIAKPLNQDEEMIIPEDKPTSMSMFVLQPDIFNNLNDIFLEFIKENKDSLDAEALLIEDLFKLILAHKLEIQVQMTKSKWFGVTYKEDKKEVLENISQLIKDNIYPEDLWHEKNH